MIPKVNAGIICWFIDLDKTLFLDIEYLDWMRDNNFKSFNAKDINGIYDIPVVTIEGIKKRVFFEYNLRKLLEEISYE